MTSSATSAPSFLGRFLAQQLGDRLKVPLGQVALHLPNKRALGI